MSACASGVVALPENERERYRYGSRLLRVWVNVHPVEGDPKTYERLYTVTHEARRQSGEPIIVRHARDDFARVAAQKIAQDGLLFGSTIERIRARWEN